MTELSDMVHEFSALADIQERVPRVSEVRDACCAYFGVTSIDILSQRRAPSIVWPRQVGMYLARNLTPRSLPQIGNLFGGRDHSTVIHAIRRVEQRMTDAGNDIHRDIPAICALISLAVETRAA